MTGRTLRVDILTAFGGLLLVTVLAVTLGSFSVVHLSCRLGDHLLWRQNLWYN